MTAIGIGKFAGARQYHTFAYRLGLEHVIRTVSRRALASGKILGGLAILEDGRHQTARLEAVPAAAMVSREEELLALVKEWTPRIPVRNLDLLVVNEIGKNISGTGMDAKVINRSIDGELNCWPGVETRIERIFIRDLSGLSYGNGVGIGMSDVIHDRILAKIDWNATWINSLDGFDPGRQPHADALFERPGMHGEDCPDGGKNGHVRNYDRVDSEHAGTFGNAAERESAGGNRGNANLEIVGAPEPIDFDAAGDLTGSPMRAVPAGELC